MAQRRTMAWTELRVGLLVIVSFVLLSLAIFFVGGEAGIFTKKIKITAYLPDGNGLRPGAEVWLDGVMVGNVSRIAIAKEPGPDHGVDVEMKLFATRNFDRPSDCRNLEQIRYYVKELCLKIEECEGRFHYVPHFAYSL